MPDDTSLDLVRLAEEVAARLISTADGPRPSFTTLAREWEPGHIHEQGTVVFHEGGIWQARLRTASRPDIETAEWVLLTNGIRFVQSYQDPDDPRAFGLLVGFTGGRSRDLRYRLALPVHRGQYRAGVHYWAGDEVEHNGATFRALIETPVEPPGGEGWTIVAARGRQGIAGERGPKGEQGDQGDRGLAGEPGRAGKDGLPGERGPRGFGIARVEGLPDQPGLIRVVLDDGSLSDPIDVAIMRYVGLYRPGESYRRGDIVRLGFALWIAAEDTESVPHATNPSWTLFLVSPEVGISGGGDRDQPPDLPTLDARYVNKAGDTMTGLLQLPATGGVGDQPSLRFAPSLTGFGFRVNDGTIFLAINGVVMATWSLTGSQLAGGALMMSNNLIQFLADPVDPQDAVNKRYVDGRAPPAIDLDPLLPRDGTRPMTGTLRFDNAAAFIQFIAGQGGIVWGAPGASSIIYDVLGLGLIFRRSVGQDELWTEPVTGNAALRRAILTSDTGVRKIGDQMTGPLIAVSGGGLTSAAIAFGDNATGFYRTGTNLVLTLGGGLNVQFMPTQVLMGVSINMATQGISNLANATAAGDAISRGFADGRYLQLIGGSVLGEVMITGPDEANTPGLTLGMRLARIYWGVGGLFIRRGTANEPVFIENHDSSNRQRVLTAVDLRATTIIAEPAQFTVTNNWESWWSGNYPIPRGGNSRLLISISLTLTGTDGAIVSVGARLAGAGQAARGGHFRYNSGDGITLNLYADVAGANPALDIQLAIINGSSTAPVNTIAAPANNRSQIMIADMGPI